MGDKKGRPKERVKDEQPAGTQKKGGAKELVPFMVGSYFTRIPSIVTYMQIMRSNSL
jgi:hypothetical protein